MKILSLFDGMSCLQIALKELNISVEKYYASEIDKFAIAQTQLNFPETIQLGSVTEWETWDIDWGSISLIGAGSPCQGFSFAGKQLAFDDPRSKLFFVFVEILNHCRKFNPDVKFLLENVDMKKDHLRIISEYVGIFPVKINSALVSAQNRERWYWTNVKTKQVGLFDELYTDIPQPKDSGIFLINILQPNECIGKKFYLSDTFLNYLKIRENRYAPPNIRDVNGKSSTITIGGEGKSGSDMNLISVIQVSTSKESGGKQPYQQNRIYDPSGKSPALMAGLSSGSNAISTGDVLRRLTPTECARLQTIPTWYIWKCSDSQIYRMLGNGWTIEVIKHILSFIQP
jgi:DNA-cytosine methyltransferase